MPLRVVVFEDTREACEAALELACQTLGLQRSLGPVQCSESWIARATQPAATEQRPAQAPWTGH